MGAALDVRGPMPAAGETLCTACVMFYKGGDPNLDDAMNAANALEDGKVVRHTLTSRFPVPQEAVAVGMNPVISQVMASMGMPVFPVPLCWSHIQGLAMRNGVIGATAADMPAEPATRGGVDLSRRRR